jgi:hypothetical protein
MAGRADKRWGVPAPNPRTKPESSAPPWLRREIIAPLIIIAAFLAAL